MRVANCMDSNVLHARVFYVLCTRHGFPFSK